MPSDPTPPTSPTASTPSAPGLTRRAALVRLGTFTAGGIGMAALVAACGDSASSVSAPASTSTPGTTAAGSGATTSGAAPATTAASGAACVLTKEQEQGPFYFPLAKVRGDITDGKAGVPMRLEITVVDVTGCKPVPNAAVDVWHADALGAYSDSSSGLFLRGIQVSGADGVARFTSIYPGWYPSRTNHVHVKVHVDGTAGATYSGGHVSHTGNLFFPEDVSTTVAKLAPYTSNKASRVPLTSDFVYKGQNGAGSVMTLRELVPGSPDKGYVAALTVAIDPAATPALIGIAGTVK